VSFNKNRSKVKVLGRLVDPFYYSFGTPYLRRDNVRIETKAEQIFWKRQLTATVTYRRDADNLYGFKQGTSITHSIILGAQLRIKKLPYLLLTYSPNYQSFYNAVANKQINSDVKLYNVIVGYTYQKQKTILSSTFSFTSYTNGTHLIVSRLGPAIYRHNYFFGITESKFYFGFRQSGVSVWPYVWINTPPIINTIYNFTATYSTSTSVAMYLNGQIQSFSGPNTATNPLITNQVVDLDPASICSIGSGAPAENVFYSNARIYNAQIYNRVLSATEIAQNYNALKSRFGLK
jgi:hypothetical protein